MINSLEEDGTIDDDFPALDRNRQIEKFAFDAFALTLINPIRNNVDSNSLIGTRFSIAPSVGARASIASDVGLSNSDTVLIKVHLYSTIEVNGLFYYR